ncbi:hypothetical protein COCON_G00130200 [Conger conger]|uniref:small monomeric GTPase n=1 Tax=Conger conger TaxID=82655 RepID=A0A9Q1HVD7_CONCO|nr:hypothetical protein COCON_G00130200 [Conger conger]
MYRRAPGRSRQIKLASARLPQTAPVGRFGGDRLNPPATRPTMPADGDVSFPPGSPETEPNERGVVVSQDPLARRANGWRFSDTGPGLWMESVRGPGATGSRGPGATGGLSREYKLVMLGEGGVGKSAIIMQFISHRFPEDHDPTIEDAYKTQIRIDDEPANLDILDTAGQAEFTAMRDQYMRAGEGFIISYSITDRRSFQEARQFKQLIYRVRRTVDTPVVLVGNKSDLAHLRQVSVEEGRGLAREFQCPFFETSAAFRYYIDEVFVALVRQIRQREEEASRGGREEVAATPLLLDPPEVPLPEETALRALREGRGAGGKGAGGAGVKRHPHQQ